MTLPSNRFMTAFSIVSASAVALMSVSASAALIEDYQFNDVAGTGLASLVNDADATADFGSNASGGNALADGAGNLVFTVGADASDNIFRNSDPARGLSSGVVTMSFTFSAASLAGGDASGANVGFGLREDVTNTELFLLRLQKQSGSLRLQTRIGGSNTTLENFGVDVLTGALEVTAVANLDTDLMDVTWILNGGAAQTSTGITITDGTYDFLRTAANTNTNDFGAADFVNVDFVTVDHTPVPEPASLALVSLGGLTLLGRRRQG